MSGTYGDELTAARIRRATDPELENQAEALLAASTVPEMSEAAQSLRLTGLSVGRLLMRPPYTFLRFDPSLLDPDRRCMELAELAVDVVTATDYLLSLLGPSVTTHLPLVLGSEAGPDRGRGPSEYDILDRLTRRRLDARGAAVRQGMRLLGRLRSDLAYQTLHPAHPHSGLTECVDSCAQGVDAARPKTELARSDGFSASSPRLQAGSG